MLIGNSGGGGSGRRAVSSFLHYTYLHEIQKHATTLYVPASCIEFHPYLTIYVESTDRNSSTHLCGSH